MRARGASAAACFDMLTPTRPGAGALTPAAATPPGCQVYGILCAQMLMTTCVAATVMFDPAVSSFVWSHPSVGILSLVLPLIGAPRGAVRRPRAHS